MTDWDDIIALHGRAVWRTVYRQAANAINVKVCAIKVLVHRARARLREVFAGAVVDWDADEVLP